MVVLGSKPFWRGPTTGGSFRSLSSNSNSNETIQRQAQFAPPFSRLPDPQQQQQQQQQQSNTFFKTRFTNSILLAEFDLRSCTETNSSSSRKAMGNVQVNQDTGSKQTKTMGQTCSKKNDGILQNYGENNELLKTAMEKVGEKNMKALPKSIRDPCWKDLRVEQGLELSELMALKNYACYGVSRGMLPSSINDGLYKVSDERVRCNFTISNFYGSIVMPADLLIDTGAEHELRLPGRKVVQLGLQQVGTPIRTQGAIPGHGKVVKFFPPVFVSATFHRRGPNGETIKEEVKELLQVSADHFDYQNALELHQGAEEPAFQNVPHTPETSSPPWFRNDTTPATPDAHPPKIEPVNLSPVLHRSLARPDELAILGFAGLRKLRMHVNAEKRQLEIEEETYLEE